MKTKYIVWIGLAMLMPMLSPVAQELKDDGSTVVSLNAEARRMVQQDRLRATLSIQKTGKKAEDVQRDINAAMQKARAAYSKVGGLKVTTGGYNVWKQYPNEPMPKADGRPGWTSEEGEKNAYWQGSQQLVLDGADREAVLKLVAVLQQQEFAVQGIDFYLSREASEALQDELMVEALGTIKSRAAKIADTMGMKTIRYARIATNGSMPGPMPYNMMRGLLLADSASAKAMPEPVAQGGESEVVVQVSADVRLK
jgi:predicted secreted protein